MNPLDLPGPQFLVLYLVVGIAVLVWLRRAAFGTRDEGPRRRPDLSDPYLIAYLRGGANEAARVACVSLVDRGLLELGANDTLRATAHAQGLRTPLEQKLADVFRTTSAAPGLFAEPGLRASCQRYDETLTELGLLPDAATVAARRGRLALALLVLVGLAAAKLYVGVSRGRPIGFLVVLAILLTVIAVKIHQPRQTGRGQALLADRRLLFKRLKERAGSLRPGGAPGDTALLAAVFGLGALPAAGFPWARRIFPRASNHSGSSCGASCGSSCGGGGGGCGGCGGGGGGD